MADITKPVTVTELKTFIEAVEFAADVEEWVPSVRQWTRIRSMIERLQESQPQPRLPMETYRQAPPEGMPMALPMPGDAGQLRMSGGGLMPAPQGLPGPFAQGQAAVRAPDVDTSNGNTYKTPFA